MENYKDLVLENQTGAISVIQENPIDVVQRIGKYQFIYDYKFGGFQMFCIKAPCGSGIAPIRYSKGDIVNVLRFEGNNAIIQNTNYKETTPDAPKSFWSGLNFGDLTKQKEFSIPKEYLQKVDDSTSATIETGINFGANPKPQPIFVIKSIPQVSSDVILEENATFVLNKDFRYNKIDNTNEHIIPDLRILKSGTKVTGNVMKPTLHYNKLKSGVYIDENQFNYLEVKGFTNSNILKIPLSYLIKENSKNNGNVVPVSNDNKKILMIVGAFLVGYVLFNKGKVNK